MLCFCAHWHEVRCPRRALVPTMRRCHLQRHFPYGSSGRAHNLRADVAVKTRADPGYAVTHSMNIPSASAADVRLCFESVAKAMPARTGVLIAGHSNERSRSPIAWGVRTRSSCEEPHITLNPPTELTSPTNILLTNAASRSGAGEER